MGGALSAPALLPGALGLLLLTACARPARPVPGAPWTRAEYFVPAVLSASPEVGRLRADWYAAALDRMGEPSFLELSRRAGEGYRFLWLRTWHPALSVRVHPVGQLAVAEAHLLDGRGRPEALGRLVAVTRRTVPAAEWQALRDQLDAAGFWALPTEDPLEPGGVEGARWVFEGYAAGRVQVVDRFSPDDPELVALGLAMLRLAGVDPDPREVY